MCKCIQNQLKFEYHRNRRYLQIMKIYRGISEKKKKSSTHSETKAMCKLLPSFGIIFFSFENDEDNLFIHLQLKPGLLQQKNQVTVSVSNHSQPFNTSNWLLLLTFHFVGPVKLFLKELTYDYHDLPSSDHHAPWNAVHHPLCMQCCQWYLLWCYLRLVADRYLFLYPRSFVHLLYSPIIQNIHSQLKAACIVIMGKVINRKIILRQSNKFLITFQIKNNQY